MFETSNLRFKLKTIKLYLLTLKTNKLYVLKKRFMRLFT